MRLLVLDTVIGTPDVMGVDTDWTIVAALDTLLILFTGFKLVVQIVVDIVGIDWGIDGGLTLTLSNIGVELTGTAAPGWPVLKPLAH